MEKRRDPGPIPKERLVNVESEEEKPAEKGLLSVVGGKSGEKHLKETKEEKV